MVELAQVMHGYMGADDTSEPCTLIVFDWRFDKPNPGKRYRSIWIKVTFAPQDHNKEKSSDPVVAMGPRGTYFMSRTTETVVKVLRNWRIAIKVPVPLPLYKWKRFRAGHRHSFELPLPVISWLGFRASDKKTTAFDRNDYIQIVGRPIVDNNDGGRRSEPNGALWKLFENASQKSGVPTQFRTAILLKRRVGDDSPFVIRFKIKTGTNRATNFALKTQKIPRQVPKDDPIIIDPSAKSATSEISKYNMGSLKEKLMELCSFTLPDTESEDGVPEGKSSAVGSSKGDA